MVCWFCCGFFRAALWAVGFAVVSSGQHCGLLVLLWFLQGSTVGCWFCCGFFRAALWAVGFVCGFFRAALWAVGCLTSQKHATVSQRRICSDKFKCCHTEIEVADQTFHLTQSQYTDSGPTSPSTDPITPGAWPGSHWRANFKVTGMTRPRRKSRRKRDSNPGSSALEADALTTRPTRRWAAQTTKLRDLRTLSPDGVKLSHSGQLVTSGISLMGIFSVRT